MLHALHPLGARRLCARRKLHDVRPRRRARCEKARLRRQQGLHGHRHRETACTTSAATCRSITTSWFVAGRTSKTDIRWKLVGEKGVEFAANGSSTQLGVPVLTRRRRQDKFVCKDAHPDFGIFKYSVNVTVKDSLFGPRGVQSLDPWVVNY